MEKKPVDNNSNKFKRNKKTFYIIIIALILIVTNLITFIVTFKMPIKGTVRISEDSYNEISKFNKMFLVKQNLEKFYDGKIDQKDLVDGAIKGMTQSLKDPYTVYMNEEDYDKVSTQLGGNYVGIGVGVEVKDNKIVIISVFDNSPAKKAGILPYDVIEKVNGNKVSGKEVDKAMSMIKGKKDTTVNLTVRRNNKTNLDMKIKRDVVDRIIVKGKMLDNNVGYVQIEEFDENSGKQFNDEIDKLKNKGMKGLIVDLRQNGGGWLTACMDITSNFVQKGKIIVSTKDKYGHEEKFNSEGGKLIGMPLVVLIDEGTASASEILSGAIRDYKAGTLIGTNTFGKGIVQSVLDKKAYGFGDGTALKVTTSKYYTPNGENIHKKGIKPDIEVKYPEELLGKPYDMSKDPQFNKALETIKGKIK